MGAAAAAALRTKRNGRRGSDSPGSSPVYFRCGVSFLTEPNIERRLFILTSAPTIPEADPLSWNGTPGFRWRCVVGGVHFPLTCVLTVRRVGKRADEEREGVAGWKAKSSGCSTISHGHGSDGITIFQKRNEERSMGLKLFFTIAICLASAVFVAGNDISQRKKR